MKVLIAVLNCIALPVVFVLKAITKNRKPITNPGRNLADIVTAKPLVREEMMR